ncbi:hypothetical protein GCM10010336_71150 [Streptomyces goshikiensis]|nr:hypothetical protein GCM10010336_71150 [Streptomyces goshikiensis]
MAATGTVMAPAPVTGLAANFSPMPLIAPPPFGRLTAGGRCGADAGVLVMPGPPPPPAALVADSLSTATTTPTRSSTRYVEASTPIPYAACATYAPFEARLWPRAPKRAARAPSAARRGTRPGKGRPTEQTVSTVTAGPTVPRTWAGRSEIVLTVTALQPSWADSASLNTTNWHDSPAADAAGGLRADQAPEVP